MADDYSRPYLGKFNGDVDSTKISLDQLELIKTVLQGTLKADDDASQVILTAIQTALAGILKVDDDASQVILTAIQTALAGTLKVDDDASQTLLTAIQTAVQGTLKVDDDASQTLLTAIQTALAGTLKVDDDASQVILTAIQTALSGTLNTHIVASDIVQSTTVQTHNAISVNLSSFADGLAFIDCSNFGTVQITLVNDAVIESSVELLWSHDGISSQVSETIMAGTEQQKLGSSVIKARWLKVRLKNADAALAHIMSSWAFFKA